MILTFTKKFFRKKIEGTGRNEREIAFLAFRPAHRLDRAMQRTRTTAVMGAVTTTTGAATNTVHVDLADFIREKRSNIRREWVRTMAEGKHQLRLDLDARIISLFGFPLRDAQWAAIESLVLDRRDTFVRLKPGQGKTLVAVAAVLIKRGLWVCTSPLSRIVYELTQTFESVGCRVLRLAGCASADESVLRSIEAIALGEVPTIVVGQPEAVVGAVFLATLRAAYSRGVLQGVVIDEAGLILDWARHFRTAMGKLGELVETCRPDGRVLLLDGTACKHDREAIYARLRVSANRVDEVVGPVDPTLTVLSVIKNSGRRLATKIQKVEDHMRRNPGSKGVLFVESVSKAEKLVKTLQMRAMGDATDEDGREDQNIVLVNDAEGGAEQGEMDSDAESDREMEEGRDNNSEEKENENECPFTMEQVESYFTKDEMDQSVLDERLAKFDDGTFTLLISTRALERGVNLKDVEFTGSLDSPGDMARYLQQLGRARRGQFSKIAFSWTWYSFDERNNRINHIVKSYPLSEDTSMGATAARRECERDLHANDIFYRYCANEYECRHVQIRRIYDATPEGGFHAEPCNTRCDVCLPNLDPPMKEVKRRANKKSPGCCRNSTSGRALLRSECIVKLQQLCHSFFEERSVGLTVGGLTKSLVSRSGLQGKSIRQFVIAACISGYIRDRPVKDIGSKTPPHKSWTVAMTARGRSEATWVMHMAMEFW